MARYIDANKIRYCWMYDADGTEHDGVTLQSIVEKTPTADVVEVKYGHWIEDEVCVYACSECGFIFTTADDISEFKFCRCGAKMDGKE